MQEEAKASRCKCPFFVLSSGREADKRLKERAVMGRGSSWAWAEPDVPSSSPLLKFPCPHSLFHSVQRYTEFPVSLLLLHQKFISDS